MCGGNTMRTLAPNANIQDSNIKRTNQSIPTGHFFDQAGVGMFRTALKRASPEKRAIFKNIGKKSPKKESAPPPVLRSSSSSASSRNLGIKNKDNVNKRKVASGRRTSKARTFSRGN